MFKVKKKDTRVMSINCVFELIDDVCIGKYRMGIR